MKKFYVKLAGAMLTLMGVLAPTTVSAQCANNNVLWQSVGNINPGQTVTINGTYGGEYNTFNCVSGSTYVIRTCNGGTWDSQLTLYNNAGGSSLAYNDDFCGLQSQITWTATFTGTVRVLLDAWPCSNLANPMTMTITRNAGGGAGNCWDGTITGTGSATGTTCNAGNESNLRSSTDRIYRVQIQQGGCYNFSLCGPSSFWDSYIYLTTACPGTGGTAGGGTIIAQNDDGCGSFAGHGVLSNVYLNPGTYFVTVEGFGSGDCGNFSLNVSNSAASAPSAGAISAPSAFGCGTVANFAVPFQTGITYTWSTTNGVITSGQGTSSVNIAWGSGSGTVSVVPMNACGTQGAASSIVAACTPPPANDQCSNATAFTGSSQAFSTVFATGTDISSCTFNDFNDVWYSWTAPACGQVTFSTVCGASFDTHLSLYSGCGGTELACNDDVADYSCNYGLTSRITANVTAGQTYRLRVAGYNGAQGTGTVFMSMSSPLSASATAGSIACFGGSTTVNVAAAGGSGEYTGTGSYTASAGTFNYTVSDSYGCSASGSIQISQPTQLTANAAISDLIDCFGGNGAITVFAAGGTAPYSGTGVFSVPAGDYTYTVTDGNGCTASVGLSIAEPTQLVASSSVTDAINCNGETGVITVSATGGTPGYTGTGDFTVNAGTYSYDVTDANGCLASTSTTITEPEVLTVNAGGDETVFYGYGPMECADLSASINGGTPDYTAVWTSNVSGGAVGADATVCPETNEVYTVSVTDANGCTASDDLSICVVNVECQAGESDIIKVEMCQIPPGNPNNAHTICVDENAVPAHLAIGCTLGACGELDNCNAVSGMAVQGAAAQKLEAMNPTLALTAYPNPTSTATTVSVTPVDKGEYTIVLTDMTGRVIANIYNGFISDYENRTFEVDMNALTGGVYVVNVIGGNGIMDNLKIVKE